VSFFSSRSRSGFTLLELLIVIVISLSLMTVMLVGFRTTIGSTRDAGAEQTLRSMARAAQDGNWTAEVTVAEMTRVWVDTNQQLAASDDTVAVARPLYVGNGKVTMVVYRVGPDEVPGSVGASYCIEWDATATGGTYSVDDYSGVQAVLNARSFRVHHSDKPNRPFGWTPSERTELGGCLS
jgi:prepilin-type N-terminal cleavage/methylation domain-containing protein